MRPLSSAIGDELVGRDGTEAPVGPAGQGLELRDAAGGQETTGWYCDPHLAAVDRAAQLLVDLDTAPRVWASSASSNSEMSGRAVRFAWYSAMSARWSRSVAVSRIVALDDRRCRR